MSTATAEQQLTHLKIRFADVVLSNIALQEQVQKLTEALENSKAPTNNKPPPK